jgi:hypothetical protein
MTERTHYSPRLLGVFLRGLVWDDEHMAFNSLNPSPLYSWGMMCSYWMIGALLALHFDYYSQLRIQLPDLIRILLDGKINIAMSTATVIVTIVANLDYYKKSNNGGRTLSLFSSILMPVMNGIFETFLFLVSFDIGVTAIQPYSSNDIVLFSSGFISFSIFSALIHAVMWGAHVLPENYDSPRAGGERTKKQSMELLFWNIIPMSLMWMTWYFFFHDIWLVIICHIYADGWIACAVRLPPPWAPHHKRKHK